MCQNTLQNKTEAQTMLGDAVWDHTLTRIAQTCTSLGFCLNFNLFRTLKRTWRSHWISSCLSNVSSSSFICFFTINLVLTGLFRVTSQPWLGIQTITPKFNNITMGSAEPRTYLKPRLMNFLLTLSCFCQ